MRLHPVWGLILFFLAALATTSLARGAEPPGRVPDGYERREIEGFTVYVNSEVLQQKFDRFGRQPLAPLERELNDLCRILHPRIVAVLREVPVWAEWDKRSHLMPSALALYWHRDAAGEMQKVGVDPRKAGCIEVYSLRILGEMRRPGTALQQIIILHEMAHAVQDRLVGWDNPELKATFQQAVDRKLYDEVNDRTGRRVRAYARSNVAEYFAEISCAYLDSCNYFPFNQEQLRGYDPAGFKFVERVWRQPERFNVIARKPAPGQLPAAPAKPAASTEPVRTDTYAERDALLKLDRLRAQIKQGQAEQARKGLQELVRTFPGTVAADDARRLLRGL
jgi:hypothetical protein